MRRSRRDCASRRSPASVTNTKLPNRSAGFDPVAASAKGAGVLVDAGAEAVAGELVAGAVVAGGVVLAGALTVTGVHWA